MRKRFWLALVLALGAGLPLWAVSVWFSSAPSSINSGTSYTVQATTSMPGGAGGMTLYKNSSAVAGNGGSSYFSVSYTATDNVGSPQTMEYHAVAIDSVNGGATADAWAYVNIVPTNSAPAGACDYTSPSLPVNGTLSGNGWAVDNEQGAPISRVDILIDGNDVGDVTLGDYRIDVANAYGRSDYTYCGWHFSVGIGSLSIGTHTVSFRAVDNQGATTDFGSRSLSVTSNAPSITLQAPVAQPPINVNTALTITSNATDADGDISAHNLDIQRPDGTWNWQGGFAYGEPYMGGPVGSGSNSTRSASFTFNQTGTWYVRSWVSDGAGNSLHSATVAINVINPNVAPLVSFTTQPPAYPNSGTNFTARATGTDTDGNLTNVQVDVQINGGAWSAFAYNGGGNGSTNTSDSNLLTAGAEGTTYKFRARSFDGGGLISNNGGYVESTVATVNRTPAVTLQVLDAAKNPLPIGGNGRAQVFINSSYYVRLSGTDPDGRLGILYERHVPVGGAEVDNQVNVSGASASYDFGPFNSGATPGFIDTWGHAADADAGGYVPTGQGWNVVGGPDIDVNKLNQGVPTITSPSTVVYGNGYTATATGGSGTGALEWRLGTTSSTAPGAAVDANTGAVTSNGTGTVYIQVRRRFDSSYNDSAWTGDFPITVTPRPITVTLAGSKTYNGTTASSGATATITSGNLAPGDVVTYSYSPAPSVNAGSYAGLATTTITNAVAPTTRTGYYSITYVGSYTINKAPLTVTANNASRTYGAANPTFTASYSGFVNGETTAVLTGAPSLTTTATATSTVGPYAIVAAAGTLAATNYSFTFQNGTLTVNKAPLMVTANNASRTYGAANPTFTASYSGFVNGETAAGLTGAPSLTTTATATSTVGPYTIVAAAGTLAATNYSFTFQNGTLTVNKAPLTVTANNASRTYGEANPTFTASYSGFVNGETTAVLTGAPSLTATATATSTVGPYTIVAAAGTLAATNYSFTFQNGTLTVNRALLTATANDASRIYGGANPTFTASYSGFVNGETTAVLTGAPSLTTTATATSAVGPYTITAAIGSLSATNYTFAFQDGTLTINKALLTVKADDTGRDYGASNPAFTASYSGFVNGETTAVLTGAPSLTTTATANSPVGAYPIVAAIGTLAATNYNFAFEGGTLTVSHADSDADGLPDYWELRYLGTLAHTGAEDPFGAGRTLAASYTGGLSPLPPASIATGLRAWYRADLGVTTGGMGGVNQWLDASGNGVHLLQPVANQQPLPAADFATGRPMLDFSGGDRLQAAAADVQASGTDLSVIVVLKPADSQVTGASVVDFNSDGQQGFGLRQNGSVTNQYKLRWRNQTQTAWEGETAPLVSASGGVSQIITLVKNGANQTAYLNGTQQASASVAAGMFTPVTTLAVGGSATNAGDYFGGQIAEVLIYNRALTTLERQQIENDLGYKYALAGFNGQSDSDGNGLPDWWERQYFGQIGISSTADADGDGISNLLEFQLGRNPLKPALSDTTGAVNLQLFAPRN